MDRCSVKHSESTPPRKKFCENLLTNAVRPSLQHSTSRSARHRRKLCNVPFMDKYSKTLSESIPLRGELCHNLLIKKIPPYN